MNFVDLLVGGVSILLGILAIGAALLNWSSSYTLWVARNIVDRLGRGYARVFYALLGVALIGLGVAIALGR